MSMGSNGTGHTAEINVTPLIDVLLVLLIIFMVIVPIAPRGLDALVPQPAKTQAADPPQTIVVDLRANPSGEPTYTINRAPIAKSDIESRLAAIFATRAEKTMFVQADPALEFNKVAEVVDMAHRADVQSVGLITPRITILR